MKFTTPIMRYHGGKFRLAPWVIGFFPEHKTYIEPFGGAAGVLLQKPRSYSEVYNDLDGDIANIFRVLRDQELSQRLARECELTPYSREEFKAAYEPAADPVERARRTLIRSFMGFGSAGATKHHTGFRLDTDRDYGTAPHLWAKYPPQIKMFHERLSGILIENKCALEVISDHDREDTLFYVDPPYLMSTRVMGANRKYYEHEMTDEQHIELLNVLDRVDGMTVLSGYDNEIYNDLLPGWKKHSTKARISAGRGTAIRTECVWLSPAVNDRQSQQQLFG